MRRLRIWSNHWSIRKRPGIFFVVLFILLCTVKLLQSPSESPDLHVDEVKVLNMKSSKDAVFDQQALRAANPSKDKVLLMGQNPYLPEDGTGPRRHPIIPHILHQTWDSELVPRRFKPWIESWQKHHLNWEYWLWTPRAVICFLNKHYPDYSLLYQEYPDDISRADVMRYFVMHYYGGIYVDLDSSCLKPVDPWTYSHQCILSEEPYEHPYLVRQNNRSNIVNSPLACRPRHPFFDQAIKALPSYAGKYFGDFLHSTGPYFLDEVYRHYKQQDPQDNITVIPPRYFLPTYDPSQSGIIDDKCSILSYAKLPPLQKQVCEMLIDRDYKNVPYPDSYMDHYWLHVNTRDASWKLKDTVKIEEIVPKVKKMSSIMCDWSVQ